jgi:hypothetical protein
VKCRRFPGKPVSARDLPIKTDDFMAVFNNIDKIFRDDLFRTVKTGSQISVVAACFSIYAYDLLKAELETVDESCLLVSAPLFIV